MIIIVMPIVLFGLFILSLKVSPTKGPMRCFLQENFYDMSFDPAPDYAFTVTATAETEPVKDRCDAADDPAIWVNPQNSAQSLVIGTNKQRSLNIYDLSGNVLSSKRLKAPNNVDVRTGISFASPSGILVGTATKDDSKVQLFALAPETGSLMDIPGAPIQAQAEEETYGFCFYRSAVTGAVYAITTDKSGVIEQWHLTARDGGGVDSKMIRQLRVDTQPEGCVADDMNGYLYVGEEDVGIWKFNAEPDTGNEKRLIAKAGIGLPDGGRLSADVEGLAIYAPAGDAKSGYLIASSQGNHAYVVFDRQSPHAWRGTFQIEHDGALAGDTDGLDVTALPVGPDYPKGMLVVQDGLYNKPGRPKHNQNFKYVSWEKIEAELQPTLSSE